MTGPPLREAPQKKKDQYLPAVHDLVRTRDSGPNGRHMTFSANLRARVSHHSLENVSRFQKFRSPAYQFNRLYIYSTLFDALPHTRVSASHPFVPGTWCCWFLTENGWIISAREDKVNNYHVQSKLRRVTGYISTNPMLALRVFFLSFFFV